MSKIPFAKLSIQGYDKSLLLKTLPSIPDYIFLKIKTLCKPSIYIWYLQQMQLCHVQIIHSLSSTKSKRLDINVTHKLQLSKKKKNTKKLVKITKSCFSNHSTWLLFFNHLPLNLPRTLLPFHILLLMLLM